MISEAPRDLLNTQTTVFEIGKQPIDLRPSASGVLYNMSKSHGDTADLNQAVSIARTLLVTEQPLITA